MTDSQAHMITIGAIASAHGVRGQFKVKSFTASPDALTDYGPLQLDDGRQLSLKIVGHAKRLLICQAGEVGDRTAAEELRGRELQIARSALPETDDSELYHTDLIGCAVVDEENLRRGTLVGLFDFGAGEVADIQIEGKKQNEMLPFVAPFLMDVNLEARSIQMQFAALEGDDEAEEDGAA